MLLFIVSTDWMPHGGWVVFLQGICVLDLLAATPSCS